MSDSLDPNSIQENSGEIEENSGELKPKRGFCMGCFGSFKRRPKKKMSQDMEEDMVKIDGNLKMKKKKKTSWISSSRFPVNSYAVKTVPVDVDVPVSNRSRELHSLRSMMSKQAAGVNHDSIPAVIPQQAINDQVNKKESEIEIEEEIVVENGELDQSNSVVKDDTSKKPTNRRKENKKTGSSNPGSPNVTIKLPSHSSSPLPSKRKKQKSAGSGAGLGGDGGGGDSIRHETHGKLDPIYGMSVVMVTLVIMLLWGKLCAMMCTCAWLILVPHLRKVMDSKVDLENETGSGIQDLDSVEYKKKVVLEGLLQRNKHRNNFVGIF